MPLLIISLVSPRRFHIDATRAHQTRASGCCVMRKNSRGAALRWLFFIAGRHAFFSPFAMLT
jgi:hypothetical protein